MPEWFVVILAIVGIVLLGFFFSALEFFKGLTKFLIFGLLVFLLFLLANRVLPTFDSSQPYGRVPSPDGGLRVPRLDPDSDLSESLRNLGENIDEFVFGPTESSPGTTPGTSTRSRDFVYQIPGTEPVAEPDSSTIAEQPTSRSSQPQGTSSQRSSQPTGSTPSPMTRSTADRYPVSGMW